MAGSLPLMQAGPSAGTVAFNPATISGLVAWYKADSLSLNDGDPVASWTDSSGTGNTVTQATAANKPLYKASIVNGKPVVRFDGSNDDLQVASEFSLGTGGHTVFVVHQTSGDGCPLGGLAANNQWRVGTGAANVISAHADLDTISDAFVTARGSWNLAEYVRASAGTSFSFYEKGTARGVGSAISAVSMAVKGVGSLPFATTLFLTGDVAEILVYNSALSGTDRGNVETYLVGKYAL